MRPSRRTFLSLSSVLASLIGSAAIATVAIAFDPTPAGEYAEVPGVQEFSGRLIVRPIQPEVWWTRGIDAAEADSRMAEARSIAESSLVEAYIPQTDEYLIRVSSGDHENGLSRALMATGLFQYAEPDWIVYPVADPNDPLFSSQWHHAPNRLQSADGWSIHTGNPSVSVGICDTGIRTTHQDLSLHRLEGYNAVDQLWESQGGSIGPVHPHGTMTTGCAAANGNNGVGIAGVGWNLSHRMLRVSNTSGGGSSLSVLQHAARTAVESGDRVASVSYSGVDNSSNLTTATYIKSLGGLLVWAAGNDGRNLTFGNRDADDIIVVGGTDQNDAKASFSAYGPFVDLTAPGVSVFTTDSGSDSDYAAVSGTSFACPLTAGLATLLWSNDGGLTPDEVELRLKQGCDDLGAGGVDNTFGYGRINVFGSLSIGGPGNQSPVASVSATPVSGDVPLIVDFDASTSSDAEGPIASFDWDWEGDGIYDATTGTNPLAQHLYSVAGTFNATVRVTDGGGLTDTASVGITGTNPGGTPVTIAFDGFESQNFSGGTGWTGTWQASGDIGIRWNQDGPHTGSGHVRERRGTGYMARTVNLTGATAVHLIFWAKVSSFESSDQALVRVSPDGVNFTTVKTFNSTNSDDVYHAYDIDLSSFAMTSTFRIAFDAAMNSTSDRWYLDDIQVNGVQ